MFVYCQKEFDTCFALYFTNDLPYTVGRSSTMFQEGEDVFKRHASVLILDVVYLFVM